MQRSNLVRLLLLVNLADHTLLNGSRLNSEVCFAPQKRKTLGHE